jgi:hypothetical protein
MSIKPGVTTMEEATTLLSASDQIDRESIEITEYGIAVKWHMGATSASFTTWVRIYASDNGADVKSITFVGLYPYTALVHKSRIGRIHQSNSGGQTSL